MGYILTELINFYLCVKHLSARHGAQAFGGREHIFY